MAAMHNHKISVIVPVYNAAEYLRKCLDSIVSQDYENLEIILINDGSTDGSSEIIDSYAVSDKRIIIRHKANGGIGSAYRTALNIVSGDYISFVDSDDFIEPKMYRVLAEVINAERPDIIHFGSRRINKAGEILATQEPGSQVITGNSNIVLAHISKYRTPSLAVRLFKAQLFESIEITGKNIGVDELTYIQVVSKCEKYVLLNKIFYNILVRNESASRTPLTRNALIEGIKIHRFICDFSRANMPEFLPRANNKYVQYLLFAMTSARADRNLRYSAEYRYVVGDFRLYRGRIRHNNELKGESITFRIYLFLRNPILIVALRNSLNSLRFWIGKSRLAIRVIAKFVVKVLHPGKSNQFSG